MSCQDNEKDITLEKQGSMFGFSVILIIYIFFIVFIVLLIMNRYQSNKSSRKTTNVTRPHTKHYNLIVQPGSSYSDTFMGRFNDWYMKIGNYINMGSILAIFAAGVVIGFNGLVMTPIIMTIFPKKINDPIQIPGKDIEINPGQFFIAVIGFVISLILLFFISELINAIRRRFENLLSIVTLVILFIFLTFMFVWNYLYMKNMYSLPNCVPIETKTTVLFSMTNKQNKQRLPHFGVFI